MPCILWMAVLMFPVKLQPFRWFLLAPSKLGNMNCHIKQCWDHRKEERRARNTSSSGLAFGPSDHLSLWSLVIMSFIRRENDETTCVTWHTFSLLQWTVCETESLWELLPSSYWKEVGKVREERRSVKQQMCFSLEIANYLGDIVSLILHDHVPVCEGRDDWLMIQLGCS